MGGVRGRPASVLFGDRELDVDRGEEGEDVGLEDSHQDLEQGEDEAEREAARGEDASTSRRRSTRKNCVAAKNSTSSRWPTIMFIRSRSVSVTGRMMNVEMNSIGVTMM